MFGSLRGHCQFDDSFRGYICDFTLKYTTFFFFFFWLKQLFSIILVFHFFLFFNLYLVVMFFHFHLCPLYFF
jgi:hypothetical protein